MSWTWTYNLAVSFNQEIGDQLRDDVTQAIVDFSDSFSGVKFCPDVACSGLEVEISATRSQAQVNFQLDGIPYVEKTNFIILYFFYRKIYFMLFLEP